eukprot:jgi/Chlat1/3985/Chrsp26S03983
MSAAAVVLPAVRAMAASSSLRFWSPVALSCCPSTTKLPPGGRQQAIAAQSASQPPRPSSRNQVQTLVWHKRRFAANATTNTERRPASPSCLSSSLQAQNVTIPRGNSSGTIDAIAYDGSNGSSSAGILLLSDVRGHRDKANGAVGRNLAKQGFYVLLVDMFRGKPWKGDYSDQEAYERWRSQHTPENILTDITAAVHHMKQRVQRLGLLGFCIGGGRVIELLAEDDANQYAAGVSFYGTRVNPRIASTIAAPLLFIAGDQDHLVTHDVVTSLQKHLFDTAACEHRLLVFPGRGHAFAHDPKADDVADAKTALTEMHAWFRQHLLKQ